MLMKKLSVITILMALAVGASAATDIKAQSQLKSIRTGLDNRHQIVDLRVQDDATIGDDAAIGGDATVAGTLAVTGVATLTVAPEVTVVTASGSATTVMTNAPAVTEETPIWIDVTYGTNSYVVPAWLKD
jgi:hypothetical protein